MISSMATLGENERREEDFEAANKDKSTSAKARLPGIDMIRVSLTWGVLLFHTTLAFSSTVPFYVFGSNFFSNTGVQYYLPNFVVNFMDVWQMPMFFFLSGVSAYHALHRRSEREFRKERVHRLLVPWLVLVLTNGVYSIIYFSPSPPPASTTLSAFLMSTYVLPITNQGWFLLHLFLYSQVDVLVLFCCM